jgi:uncharacterized protein YcbK (DUF882 family)
MIAMTLPEGRFFTPAEMRCRSGEEYPASWGVRLAVLFDAMDVIREAWGQPVTVVSGYRSPEYNKRIGAVDGSQHPLGRAADLRPYAPKGVKRTSATIHAFHNLINLLIEEGKLPAVGGVGSYPLVFDASSDLWVPGFVHVDSRPKPPSGHIARWEGSAHGDEIIAPLV